MPEEIYTLETEILHWEQQLEALDADLRLAKQELRTATMALVEYESSLRAFWNKLTGKHADTLEQLSREKRFAQANQEQLHRQLEEAKTRLETLKIRQAGLPSWQSLREGDNPARWAQLEASLCALTLLPQLDRMDEALIEYRKMLRGEIPMLSIGEQQRISTAPIRAAEKQKDVLCRLEKALEILESQEKIPEFFQNPAGFLAAAARHNQLERAAEAEAHILRLRKLLKRYR